MDQERTSPTLTFLFTDLEGSTHRWEQSPDAMRDALERHDAIIRSAVTASGGRVVKSTGDGAMAVFTSAAAGLSASITAQRSLADEPWGDGGPLRVRMGLHTGQAQTRDEDYFGRTVNRTARIMAVGHGGQVLLSSATAELVADDLPDGVTLLDLGRHRLKDLERAEHLFQVTATGLDTDFPPLGTLDARPNNIPTQVSTFVGRAAELAEIRTLLATEAVRLLTLTGPGGTGKTRLALRVASETIESFHDGVFFVDLSDVDNAEGLVAGLARALGLTQTSDRPMLESLKAHLAQRQELLVLDNFEQVTTAALVLLDLLHESSGLTILVTSRQPLHVRGENVFPVPPLSLPAPLPGPTTSWELARSEAVQLFVERAREVRPEFELTPENAPVVAQICLRLDGLPLAIELAAARLPLFSPQALLDRLSDRLGLLRTGARDLPERQQTLRATIEWSYQLLGGEERRLFELLSAFPSADVDALETVTAALPASLEPPADVLEGLASLVDKSLVRTSGNGAAPRFGMLETIRELGTERLDARPEYAAAVRRAHAVYFAELAERRHAELTAHPEVALPEVLADLENLHLAWRYWIAAQDLERLDQLLHTLWFVADAQGWYQLTVELTTDLLKVLSASPPSRERDAREVTLRTTVGRALLAIRGFSAEVEAAYSLALDLFEREELPSEFPVLRSLASFYTTTGDKAKGQQLGREILRLAEREGNSSILVDGHLIVAANVAFGEPLTALHHLDLTLRQFNSEPYQPGPYRAGVNPGVACHTTSALLLVQIGRADSARDHADRAVALATELDHPYTLAYALFHSGYLHYWRREPERAWQRAEELLAVVDAHDFAVWRAVGTCLLGAARTELGEPERGLALMDEGTDLYRRLASPPVFWPMLLLMSASARLQGERPHEALPLAEEVLGMIDMPPLSILVAEAYLLEGDVLLAHPDRGAGTAETWFQRAYDVAESFGLETISLRAAVRLARISRGADSDRQAMQQLQTVYDRLTEGLDLADAREAQEVLQRLESRR
jgi:predicted ATPase/class 3 adenylate cyclase